jgi:multicomponent Na+:H+ antiporter subunit D
MTFNLVTLIWIAFPFLIGFTIYLIPKFDRSLALLGTIASAGYGGYLLLSNAAPLTLRLMDHFGVSLILDPLAGFFILTNALVTMAVVLYCWRTEKSPFFYAQALILHGSLNSAFACSDFISLYVALEVISIASFLLIAYPRTDRSLWVALRYLFISNVAMLFYLVGAILIYQTHHSFDFIGLKGAPTEAVSLIFLGLLVKGGVFVSGLWLPLTHAEAETPVSALMSGIVVKAGIFPLVRCALLLEEINPIVRWLGLATAMLGVSCAVFEKDTKRMLAFHTVSQLGFILAAPVVGGFYALTHGLVKSALFLMVGNLPSRDFKVLQQNPIDTRLWIGLTIASLSISGMPLLAGFGTKVLTLKELLPWQVIVMNIASLGTAISFAKFIFLPHGDAKPESSTTKSVALKPVNHGFWWAIGLLLGCLVLGNGLYLKAYALDNILKSVGTIGLGWLAYWFIFRKLSIKLPRVMEQFEHLVGVMSLSLVVLFWMFFV